MKTNNHFFNELKDITGNRLVLLMYTVLPVILFTTFALIYSNSLVREIPVAIMDMDQSDISSTITKYVESSPSMKIVKYIKDEKEIKEAFFNGDIYALFYFPQDMSVNIKKGIPANVIMYINASNLIISNSILNDGSKILKTVSGGILLKKFKSAGMTEDQAMNLVRPVAVETMALYNPGYSYLNYLVPGLCAFVYMMIIISGTVLMFHGRHENLLKRSAAHFMFHLCNTLILTAIIFYVFNARLTGSVTLLLLYLIYFFIISFLTGLLFSLIYSKQNLAVESSLLIFTPAFIYSGLTYPLWAMPGIHRILAELIPFTPFLSGLQKIYLMGAPLRLIGTDLIKLTVFLLVISTADIILLKLKKDKKEIIEKEELLAMGEVE